MGALIPILGQLFSVILPLLKDDTVMNALLVSDSITPEQKAQITAMRKVAIEDWDALAPKE